MVNVKIESQGESPHLQDAVLRLHSQSPPSSIALNTSISVSAVATSGLTGEGSTSFQQNDINTQSATQAFMSTEWSVFTFIFAPQEELISSKTFFELHPTTVIISLTNH